MGSKRAILDGALQASATLLRAVVLKRGTPLFVSWNVTFRCNKTCRYCGSWKADTPELETGEIVSSLDGLYDLGARWLTLGGGEPLLRDDIGAIVRHAKSRGFGVYLSTNGSLLPDRLDEVRAVDKVTLSLEGTEAIHDRIRGKGAYRETEAAVGACREAGLDVGLQCTLSKHNLDGLSGVLDFAERHSVKAMFQPATVNLDSSVEANPIAPPVEPYRRTVAELIAMKRKGAPVANSVTGLRHLAKWPGPAKIPCSAGRTICVIEPDGRILACHQAQTHLLTERWLKSGSVADRFHGMQVPRSCTQCWCAPLVEIDLIFSLRPEAIWNTLKMMV